MNKLVFFYPVPFQGGQRPLSGWYNLEVRFNGLRGQLGFSETCHRNLEVCGAELFWPEQRYHALCRDGIVDLHGGGMPGGSVDVPLSAVLFVNDGIFCWSEGLPGTRRLLLAGADAAAKLI